MTELRISGGLLRGRKVAVPEPARPTEGRVREALFSIWAQRIESGSFLDLFAGSGAVGFEAWSRGASAVVMVDSSKKVAETLAESRGKLGISPKAAQIVLAELPARKPSFAGPFDLIFADPPYDFRLLEELLAMAGPMLARDGELALEHSSRTMPPEAAGGLALNRVKRYGGSALTFYRPVVLE